MTNTSPPPSPDAWATDWELRLDDIYETMREMSLQTDPQEMVRAYGRRMKKVFPLQRRISLSRRGLEYPRYRVTRYSEWNDDINPWAEPDKTIIHSGGLFAELIYGDRPRVFDDYTFADDDPARAYFDDEHRSLLAIPLLDAGQALNMVVFGRSGVGAFNRDRLPEHFWLANMFGRATHALVLSAELRQAYNHLDREMKSVAKIQRSLLPQQTPEVPNLTLATYYRTSDRAGGDYYDFFPLADGKWGLLIADVSGHGTPAAVVMAITHTIAHLAPQRPGEQCDPGVLLAFLNDQLATNYTNGFEAFVTAFYAIFDPETRVLTYATAGHNPPRLWRMRSQSVVPLNDGGNLPLGLSPGLTYEPGEVALHAGDKLVLYTDGVTEAAGSENELFGTERLDHILANCCQHTAQDVVDDITQVVGEFTNYAPPDDDRTLVVATVR